MARFSWKKAFGIVFPVIYLANWSLLRDRKAPGAADLRANFRPTAASYGHVVPLVFGTTLVSAPAFVRGLLEAQGDVWRQWQLMLGLCQGPVSAVQAVWLSEGAERDAAKTTRIPWARMVECGATLQAGALDGNEATNPAFSLGSTNDVRWERDATTGNGRIKIIESSTRSFLPTLLGVTSLRLSTVLVPSSLISEPSIRAQHRIDGTYPIATIGEKEIVLSAPFAVPTGWIMDAGEIVSATPYSLSSAAGGFRYPGVGHIRADPLNLAALYQGLDPATTLTPTYEAEASVFCVGAGPEGLDAEGVDVLAALIGSDYWAANLGEPIEVDVGADGTSASGARTYCRAAGFHVSSALTEQRSTAEHMQSVLDAMDCVIVPSEGKLKVLPLGDEPLSANGADFTPNTTPVYDLGPGSMLATGSQPMVSVDARPDSAAYNVVAVEFRDRHAGGAAYRVAVETAFDAADIQEQAALTGGTGKREAPPAVLHGITSSEHARQIAHLRLQRARAMRNAQQVRCGWNKAKVEGMDLLTITDPAQGLDHAPVRVIAVEGNHLGERTFSTIDWPIGTAGKARFETTSSDTAAPVQVDPGPAEAPLVVPVPSYLAGQKPAAWVAATGLGEMYGGCDVHLSADGVAYSYAGTIRGRSAMGTLDAALPSGSALDDVNGLLVDLSASRGILAGTTAAGRDDLETLCWVDGELVAFRDATPGTASYTYTLESLRRGAHGTTIAAHDAGDAFLRVDSSVLRIALPESRFGVPLYVKLVPFNIYGGGRPALGDVTAHEVTLELQTPVSPSTCLLSVLTSPPAPAADQWRASASELLHGRWARVQWEMAGGQGEQLPHRYWRYYVASATAGNYVGLRETEMRSALGGADITGSGTATADSSYSTNTPDKAVDDSAGTNWLSGGGALPHWWQYDFGSPVEIAEFTWTLHAAATESPSELALQWSDNGTDWTTAEEWTGLTWSAGETKTFVVYDPGAAELADGFEVALFTGTDPDAASAYVLPLQAVAAHVRDAVLSVSAGAAELTVRAAVRAIHAGGVPSPWRTSASDVIDAGTSPVAEAVASASSALTLAGSKTKVFHQTTAPASGMVAGDVWFDTTEYVDSDDVTKKRYAPYTYDGAVWVPHDKKLIVTSEFASGSVVTDTLAARAVTIDKLAVGGKNLLRDPEFASLRWFNGSLADPTHGDIWLEAWNVRDYEARPCTVGINLTADWTLFGDTNVSTNPGGNTVYIEQPSAYLNGALAYAVASYEVPVAVGAYYLASVYTGAHRCEGRVAIHWFDEAKAYLGTSDDATASARNVAEKPTFGTSEKGQVLDHYKRVWRKAQAPSGAAFARLEILKYDTVSGASPADSYLFFARPMFEQVEAAQAAPSPWSSGLVEIGDGRVVADVVKTRNYEEDSTGKAIAGAKMDAAGVAMKVSPDGLRVGGTLFSDLWSWAWTRSSGPYSIVIGAGQEGGRLLSQFTSIAREASFLRGCVTTGAVATALKVTSAGNYMVWWNVGVSKPSAGSIVTAALTINGTPQGNTQKSAPAPLANQTNPMSAAYALTLSAGDELQLSVYCYEGTVYFSGYDLTIQRLPD